VRSLLVLTLLLAADASVARPAAAQVPDTSVVHLGPAGGGTNAFVAWPTGKAPFPAVIVVHEWWGLNGQIRHVARRLAQEGYVAVVPDLYHGKVAADPEQAHVLARGVEPEQAIGELEAAADWLRAEPRVGKSRIGVIGFCMGGGYALHFALSSTEPAAVVMFYGNPLTEDGRLSALRAPLQAHFGRIDEGIPTARVEAFRLALRKAGKSAEIHLYPGAGHAFMNDDRPSYHAGAARQAWARTLAFFQKRLKG
jgi:carboxymethylenebutenolidase